MKNKKYTIIVITLLVLLLLTPRVFAEVLSEKQKIEIELINIELALILASKKVDIRYKQDLNINTLSNNQKVLYTECRKVGITDNAQLANVFAQVELESNFVPKTEYRAADWQTYLLNLQNRYWHTNFMGRGMIQLTWQSNYQKMSDVFNIDLVSQPNLANDITIASAIACYGMKKGSFTSVKLDDFINNSIISYYQARRIVNALDKAALISENSMKWYNVLTQ